MSNPLVQQGKKGRLAITGPTHKGTMLTIILDSEGKEGVYYPVTAYPASRKYRKIYEKEKEVKRQYDRSKEKYDTRF